MSDKRDNVSRKTELQKDSEEEVRSRLEKESLYREVLDGALKRGGVVNLHAAMKEIALNDLYFLLTTILHRQDVRHDWLYARCMEVQANPDGYLDLWSREHYKALAIDVPVPTPDGWRKHGDLKVGDYVFGPDGKPCKVVAVTPVFLDADCYEIRFDGASPITCSGNHLWQVEKKSRCRAPGERNKRFPKDVLVLSTEQIFAHGFKEDARLSIRAAAHLDLPSADLPVDPYVLGVWLGDGSKSGPRITVGLDCADEVKALLSSTGIYVSRTKHSNSVALHLGNGVRGKRGSSDLMNSLRGMGVVNNKHIPEMYLWASINQRLELLRGLMDTDGHVNTRGTAVFVNTNEVLARGFYDLAVSLGFKPKFREYRAKLNGEDKGACYRIQFQAGIDPVPFRLSAKVHRCKPRTSRSNAHFIRGVERVATVPVSCIQVDREDGLYLAGRDMVVTHNSTIISFALTIQDILRNPEVTVGVFSCTRPLAKRLLRQIKFEFESNELLKTVFSDVLYQDPRKESPKWSEDDGIIIKRKSNPAASTVEAWGLVDGQPTGKHFSLIVYDDVVTKESVTTPEMIRKVTESWELSLNLGAHGGAFRYIGTRYHMNDTYQTIMERGSAISRVYPATADGKPDGEPVFLDRESLARKRRDMGPYTFACLGAGTLVTMADWSQKPIEQVRVGDAVVGYAHINGSKTTLTPTLVVATGTRAMPAVLSTMEDGSVLVHTKEHKWWTNRVEKGRREYSPLGPKKNHQQQSLCKAIDLSFLQEQFSVEQTVAAGYIAGMIDGEGGVRHATIQITQDCFLHPEVCEKIEWALETLGVKYGVFDKDRRGLDATRNASGVQRIYTIHGGRQERVRLLHILGPYLGKKQCVVSQAYGTRNFGKGCKVKLSNQIEIGEVQVYNIQTETGNYIANGFCSKNSQMLQNPTADDAQGFDRAWLKHTRIETTAGMNLYILVDPAGEKKKTNDYTVMIVVALGQDENYYIVDMVRDRLNLTERGRRLMQLHRLYRPKGVGYEKYGLQSDIEFVKYLQGQENYRFDITPLGGPMPKNDRIRGLIPLFEQGRVYLPMTLYYADYQGRSSDLIRDFIEHEYISFPVSSHDDMLDCFARIIDPDLGAIFPKVVKPQSVAAKRRRTRSAMAA